MPWSFSTKSQNVLKADTPEWIELWAVARYDLRLSEKEFWDLSWDQLQALLKRYEQDLELQNYRTAMICATVLEPYRDRKKHKKPFTAQDFMPKKDLTEDQMLNRMKGIAMTLGGEIK
jgi:hypothetical protein